MKAWPFDPAKPTPYPDVNAILSDLLPRIGGALGPNLRGIYLIGSLVAGDFDPRRSDIDLLIVTDTAVSPEQFAALQAAHREIFAGASSWATEVEAYYLTEAALRRDDPSFGEHLKVNRGEGGVLEPLHRDDGWLIQSHLFREHGVPLIGPDPRTLTDPVAPGDLRRVVATSTPAWLGSVLADPDKLRHGGFPIYLVLTLCRVLYTLAHDVVASKQVAGQWARVALDERWTSLVDGALAWRKDDLAAQGKVTSDGEVKTTLRLIRYTIAQCQASID